MSASYRNAALGICALLALQIVWHGLLFPSTVAPVWLVAGLFALPILPAAMMLVSRHRHAPFWGAVAALFYFCHGLAEAWAVPQTRWLALTEAALSVGLIVAFSWDAMKARFNKAKPPTL